MAVPDLAVVEKAVMPKARQYWPAYSADSSGVKENTVQSLRSFFKPEQQALEWFKAVKGRKEVALEVAHAVRELLAQSWLCSKHLPLLSTLERTIKLLHAQHELICAAVLELLLVEVFQAAWHMARQDRRSSLADMLGKWLSHNGPPWRIFLQPLIVLVPAAASKTETDLSGRMASLNLQDTAVSGKQGQHQLEDGEIIVETDAAPHKENAWPDGAGKMMLAQSWGPRLVQPPQPPCFFPAPSLNMPCMPSAPIQQHQQIRSQAWIAAADVSQVRRRLREVGDGLRMLRPLQDERGMLLDRLRELQPHTAKPIKLVCWCGQDLQWQIGDMHCGREQPRTPKGHKLQLKRIECQYCRCQRAIQMDLKGPFDPAVHWRPIDRCCPNPDCAKGFHGAECRKSGSDIVSVH